MRLVYSDRRASHIVRCIFAVERNIPDYLIGSRCSHIVCIHIATAIIVVVLRVIFTIVVFVIIL